MLLTRCTANLFDNRVKQLIDNLVCPIPLYNDKLHEE